MFLHSIIVYLLSSLWSKSWWPSGPRDCPYVQSWQRKVSANHKFMLLGHYSIEPAAMLMLAVFSLKLVCMFSQVQQVGKRMDTEVCNVRTPGKLKYEREQKNHKGFVTWGKWATEEKTNKQKQQPMFWKGVWYIEVQCCLAFRVLSCYHVLSFMTCTDLQRRTWWTSLRTPIRNTGISLQSLMPHGDCKPLSLLLLSLSLLLFIHFIFFHFQWIILCYENAKYLVSETWSPFIFRGTICAPLDVLLLYFHVFSGLSVFCF